MRLGSTVVAQSKARFRQNGVPRGFEGTQVHLIKSEADRTPKAIARA